MNEIGKPMGTAASNEALPSVDEFAHSQGHTAESSCLNCGTQLVGAHCHACGQRAHVHRTIGAFAHDLLHGILHFEGKIWRTLPLLVWQPGKLTREYIYRKRVRYVSPIALFLFVVFLSFAAFNILGAGEALEAPRNVLAPARAAYDENSEKLAALRREKAALPASDISRRSEIDGNIEKLEDDQQGLRLVLGNVSSNISKDFADGFAQNPLPPESSLAKVIEQVRANPQLAIYKAQTNAYKYSWMLIPLSVPFVWLLFPFSRRFGAYDHTVFATYSITFMIALAAVASVFFFAGWGGVGALLLLVAPLHMYRQLRGSYALSRFGAGWRMLALSLFAWVTIGLFGSIVGLLTA